MIDQASASDLYPFTHPGHHAIFYKLLHSLRCSVCQNQSLNDSMAPIALDLRSEIYKQVLNNHSEQQIIHFVTQRYGTTVLYEPPLQWQTILLWFGPLFFLLVAGIYLSKLLKK
jgi:cytochrome c-type biogenesis protein CcmH